MTKQMNEYVLLLNTAAAPAPGDTACQPATFQANLNQWININGANADVIATENGSASRLRSDASAVSLVCTEDIARRVVEAFSGAVASIKMDKENVITLPDPLPKKARRPGFGA